MSTQDNKMTIQETMRQIELETETKVIQGYKTGKIQLPKLSEDGKTLEPQLNESNKQIDFLKNIMDEGSKKFEVAAGRQMSYQEMRQMFG